MKDDSDKRGMEIRQTDDGFEVDFLNRTISDGDERIKLSKITLIFPGITAPEWFIKPASNMTFIRFQDNCRLTMTRAEIEELDGSSFDAAQFWAERSERKPRKPVALKPETVGKAFAKMTDQDKAETLKVLSSDPKFQEMLNVLFK